MFLVLGMSPQSCMASLSNETHSFGFLLHLQGWSLLIQFLCNKKQDNKWSNPYKCYLLRYLRAFPINIQHNLDIVQTPHKNTVKFYKWNTVLCMGVNYKNSPLCSATWELQLSGTSMHQRHNIPTTLYIRSQFIRNVFQCIRHTSMH